MRVSKNQVKLLSAAVAALFVSSAYSQQVITLAPSATGTATGSRLYAAEIGTGRTAVGTNIVQVNSQLGVGTSTNQLRYLKYTLSNDGRFQTAVVQGDLTGVANGGNGAGLAASFTPTVSLGGTTADNNVIFQITTPNGANITDGVQFALPGGVNVAGTTSTVAVTYEVYETLSAAQQGTGNLYSRASNVATFGSSYSFKVNSATLPTQIATAASGFKNFNSGATGSAASNTVTAVVGRLDLGLASTAPRLADGTTVDATSLFGTILGNTSVTVSGDFAAAASNTSVSLASTNNVASTFVKSATGTAVINIATAAAMVNNAVSYVVDGTTAVGSSGATSTYTVAGSFIGRTGYKNTSVAAFNSGTITRDGVTLESPWVAISPGFTSRFFLTQTSGGPVGYTVTIRRKDGTSATATGTLANGTSTRVDVVDQGAGTPFLLPATTASSDGPYQITFAIQSDASVTQGTYVLTAPGGAAVTNTPLYRASQR
jgi:hypothetical protein